MNQELKKNTIEINSLKQQVNLLINFNKKWNRYSDCY